MVVEVGWVMQQNNVSIDFTCAHGSFAFCRGGFGISMASLRYANDEFTEMLGGSQGFESSRRLIKIKNLIDYRLQVFTSYKLVHFQEILPGTYINAIHSDVPGKKRKEAGGRWTKSCENADECDLTAGSNRLEGLLERARPSYFNNMVDSPMFCQLRDDIRPLGRLLVVNGLPSTQLLGSSQLLMAAR
jgi:hypothetical protein